MTAGAQVKSHLLHNSPGKEWKPPFITLHVGIGHTCPVNSVSGLFIRCIRKNLQEENMGENICTLIAIHPIPSPPLTYSVVLPSQATPHI